MKRDLGRADRNYMFRREPMTPCSPGGAFFEERELSRGERRAFRWARMQFHFLIALSSVGALTFLFLFGLGLSIEKPVRRLERYASSKLKLDAMYLNGKEHGPWRRWYRNGRVIEEGHFFHGKPEGCWRYWHPNGQLAKKACFEGGLYDGHVMTFDHKGRITSDWFYRQGESLKVKTFFFRASG